MSGYVGYALKAGKSKTGQKILSKVKDFFTGGKSKSKTISSVPPAVGKLKKTQDAKNKITGITDKYAVGFAKDDPKLLKKFRQGSKKNLDSISKIYENSKKDGGRIGRKFGGGADLKDIPAGKKFNGLRKLPKEVRNKMKYKKDGGKI
tara:strand:- start:43 stop:486 length:444 start_codon:yes stop_codon:yes gene_type:complete